MKATLYFPHDNNARGDERIVRLMAAMGCEGYGLYWCLIEKLHEADGWLHEDHAILAFDMRTQCERIQQILHDFDLFIFKEGRFSSKRVLENIKFRKDRSSKARDSASKRWDGNAGALRSHSVGNANKENKENKRDSIERGSALTPHAEKPLTDIQMVVKGWKMLTNIPTEGPESSAWDKVHFARCAKPAKSLMELFGVNGWEGAVEAMEYVYMTLTAKKLSCTLETVVKHSDLYREYKAGRVTV